MPAGRMYLSSRGYEPSYHRSRRIAPLHRYRKSYRRHTRSRRAKANVRQAFKMYKPKAKVLIPNLMNTRLVGLPRQFPMILRNNVTLAIATPASNLLATYVLNSLFEPFPATPTDQPYQFDQIGALYKKYICYGAKITIQYTNTTTVGSQIHLLVDTSATAPTYNYNLQIEQAVDTMTCNINGTSTSINSISKYVHVGRAFGVNKITKDDNEFSGTTSTDPPRLLYLYVYGEPTNGSSAGNLQGDLNITVDHYSTFFDLQRVAES